MLLQADGERLQLQQRAEEAYQGLQARVLQQEQQLLGTREAATRELADKDQQLAALRAALAAKEAEAAAAK